MNGKHELININHFQAVQISGLLGESRSFIYAYSHSKTKVAMWNDFTPETEPRSVTFSHSNDRNFSDTSDLIGQTVSENVFFIYFLKVVHGPGP